MTFASSQTSASRKLVSVDGYDPLERERLTNSILELYDFVLGTLLSAEMTQKQNVIFRYVTRLMLHISSSARSALSATSRVTISAGGRSAGQP